MTSRENQESCYVGLCLIGEITGHSINQSRNNTQRKDRAIALKPLKTEIDNKKE